MAVPEGLGRKHGRLQLVQLEARIIECLPPAERLDVLEAEFQTKRSEAKAGSCDVFSPPLAEPDDCPVRMPHNTAPQRIRRANAHILLRIKKYVVLSTLPIGR